MESKRKINGGSAVAGDDVDDRATKRRKLPIEDAASTTGETAEGTTETGLKFMEMIKKTEDKSGRRIATGFLTLPNKRQLPDYYKFTKMPIALDTIEAKLINRQFPTLTALEGDFKRMIANAKEYNEKGSVIYDDAERMRKALSNYMSKTNPIYKLIPGFSTVATPLLKEEEPSDKDEGDEDAEGELEAELEIEAPKKKQGRPPKTTHTRGSMTPASESNYAGVDYSTLTFQQAQEKIMEEMISYQEDPKDEIPAFGDFIDLPPRSLRDYYKVILNPVSLRQLQKRVKGTRGKSDAAIASDFKNWAAFEEEVSCIWKNAWHYNEDGSDISLRAKELQIFFNKALHEAKQAIPEPAGTKIKLKVSNPDAGPRITLKFPAGGKASPRDSPAPQTNGAGNHGVPMNGTARRNPFGGSHSSATPVPSLDQLERARSMSGSVASPTPSNAAPVKNEDARNSPAVVAGFNHRAPSQTVSTPGLNGNGMPPPSTPGLPNQYSQGGYAQSFNHSAQYHPPNLGFDSKWRQPGKTASDAMITNLSLATHPLLNLPKPFRMDLPPSPTMAQQSITISLPAAHYYLQIKPTLAAGLFERQYKLFATNGLTRLHAVPTIPGHSVDQQHPLFETRLNPGVNRIEIELIASLPKTAPRPANGQDVELEKITIFANLMRS